MPDAIQPEWVFFSHSNWHFPSDSFQSRMFSVKHTWGPTHTQHHCLLLSLPTPVSSWDAWWQLSGAMVSFWPRRSPEDQESTLFQSYQWHLHPNYISVPPSSWMLPRCSMGCWFHQQWRCRRAFSGAGVGEESPLPPGASKPRHLEDVETAGMTYSHPLPGRGTAGRYLLERKEEPQSREVLLA